MRKKFLSGLLWVVFANLLVKPFWLLGIDVGMQNAVGTEEYGFYFAIFNLAYIFNILLDMGITNFNTRNIARNNVLIQKYLSGILSVKLLLLGLYLIVTCSVGLLMGYGARQFRLLLWLCVNQFLNSMITYLRSNFEGLLLFRMDSVLSVLDRILMIIICSWLLWGHYAQREGLCIEWFVYAQTVAYLLTAGVALGVLIHKVGWRGLRWKRAFSIAILKRSAPFALLVLLMAGYNRLDPILLQRMLPGNGDYQAGVYAAAFRLLDAITVLAYLVSVPLLPIYSKLTHLRDVPSGSTSGTSPHLPLQARAELGEITHLITGLMLAASIGIAICIIAFGREILALLYPEHVEETYGVLRTLIVGLVPISMTYIYGTLLTANGNLKQLNLFAAISLVLNVLVNLLCIPRWQAQGAAVASLAAQSFICVAQIVLSMKLFRLRPTGGLLWRVALFAGGDAVAALLLHRWLPGWGGLGLLVMGTVAWAMVLRLIDIRQICTILSDKDSRPHTMNGGETTL